MTNRFLKDKELFDYTLWGGISAILNICLFQFFIFIGMTYKVGNIITILIVKLFCYVTNKFFVYHKKCKNITELLREIFSFFSARFATFLLDYFSVVFLVDIIGLSTLLSKIISTITVICINYVFSKRIFSKT